MSVMSVRIDDNKRKTLKVIASIKGKTMGGILSELIDDYINKNKEKIKHLSENEGLKEIMKMSESSFMKWEIILVSFPFTNLISSKKRPALIVSPDEYNNEMDVVIAFITSKMDLQYRFGDYKIKNWQETNLPKPSMIRMKFATIDKSIILKKLGKLKKEDIINFKNQLIKFFTQ
jgi:mRNA interferase MazF